MPQELLTVAAQSVKVVAGQLADRQRLKRGVEVVHPLEAQQRLFEVPPAPHLWRGAAGAESKMQKTVTD